MSPLQASNPASQQETSCRVSCQSYGQLPDGREVSLFTLSNSNGVTAKVTNYGAILAGMLVPDKDGTIRDLAHGFDDLTGWLDNDPYFGATVGRFGNRIAKGAFTLDGKDYSLATNNDPAGVPCHLHGGVVGFSHVLWEAEAIEGGVRLSHCSPDNDEGYPGELKVTVTYLLSDSNELTWKAEATTSRPTPINLIHHSYWNLSGNPETAITNHELTINADHYLPTGEDMIPTGEKKPVEGTPMDFRHATAVGSRIQSDYPALVYGNGYDHCWIINGEGLRLAAKATDPETGRSLEVHTDQPAIQFYTANYLDGTLNGKDGVRYQRRTALCLETENFPDGPNKPEFPNCILRPGETYRHTLVHKFSW